MAASRRPRSRRTGSLRIHQQLTIAALLPVLVLGAVVTMVGAVALRRISLDLVLQRNTALVEAAAGGMTKSLEAYVHPLQAAADVLGEHDDAAGQQEGVLADWAPFLTAFDGGVTLLDRQGLAIAGTPGHREREGLNYSFRDYFQAVRTSRGPVFSAVLREVPSGQDAVVIAVPVMHADGFAGVLIGVVFLDSHAWADELAPLQVRTGSQAYLIDTAGSVIFHPDTASIGTRLLDDTALSQMVAGGRPQSLLRRIAPSGQQFVVSYAPLTGIGWGLIMEEPWASIVAPAAPYEWAVAILLLIGAILSSVVLLASVRHATRPLSALVREAEQVAGGATFRPLQAQGPQEVQTLIRVFNQMVSRLAQQQAALRQYAIQVLQSQEEERKRLSRELHDETVQQVVGLVQRIELCRNELTRDPTAAARRFDELESLAKAAVADLRRMSNDLRPLILEDLGLPAAVQALCDDLAQAMPACRVHCEIVGSQRRLDPEVELAVFRIVQEALNNLRKHARASTQANITIYFERGEIVATVEDNGPGFEIPDVQSLVRAGHLGLAGMYERADLFDGNVTIASERGTGTLITVRMPRKRCEGSADETAGSQTAAEPNP